MLGALAAAGWIVRQDWIAGQGDGRVVAAAVRAFEPFGRRRG